VTSLTKKSLFLNKRNELGGASTRATWIVLILVLLFSLFVFAFKVTAEVAELSVQPDSSKIWGKDETLTINVTVTDVSDLYGWQFKLYYDPRILNGTSIIEGPFLKSGGETFSETSFNDGYNTTHGRATAFSSLTGNASGVTGSGVLATVIFKTKALGTSLLELSETVLGNPDGEEITHNVADGAVQVVKAIHDVAIWNVTVSSTEIVEGHSADIMVDVANEGNKTETFNVTTYRNETIIATQTVSTLAAGANTTLTFVWSTTGLPPNASYTIKAEASEVSDETDLTDNVFVYGIVRIVEGVHDVAINSVVPSPTKVYEGELVNIDVVVANPGDYTESFTVTVHYNETVIAEQTVSNLQFGSEQTLNFVWDTTGMATNMTYLIEAAANSVPEEIDLANNNFTDGSVTVYRRGLLSIEIIELVHCDQLGQPRTSFAVGTVAYFNVVVDSKSFKAENVLITVNLYDAGANAIGVVSFQGPVTPGTTSFILGTPIPNTAYLGEATIYANALSDWPHLGGTAYCPEKSATFEIGGS